ncbi:transcription antitermination factor NusB [candidate division KSB1 bacterium]|nr:transcription antitermination factor NusB [candidate division KSB1 bacterium]
MSSRRKSRELALCAYYAQEMSKNSTEQALNDVAILTEKVDQSVIAFAQKLLQKTIDLQVECDDLIKAKALNWDFKRIAILDKLILRIAICEFLQFEDIPPKVSIDEAIEISKKFSTDKSGKFINGILDSILNDLKNAGRIVKSGRGLLEKTL